MKTTIIPKITLGPIDASSEETRRLVRDAFPGIYYLSVDSLSDQIPRLRAFVDLANHVGLPAATAAAIRDEAEANIDGYIDDISAIYREIFRLEGRAGPMFPVGSLVTDINTGSRYRITYGPDKVSMEDGTVPAYMYSCGTRVFVCSQEEMEDGRFVLAESVV